MVSKNKRSLKLLNGPPVAAVRPRIRFFPLGILITERSVRSEDGSIIQSRRKYGPSVCLEKKPLLLAPIGPDCSTVISSFNLVCLLRNQSTGAGAHCSPNIFPRNREDSRRSPFSLNLLTAFCTPRGRAGPAGDDDRHRSFFRLIRVP